MEGAERVEGSDLWLPRVVSCVGFGVKVVVKVLGSKDPTKD